MKALAIFILWSFSSVVFSKHVIINHGHSNQKCQGKNCQQIEDNFIQSFNVGTDDSKKSSRNTKKYHLKINGKTFKVSILDKQEGATFTPLYKVKYKTKINKSGPDIYGVFATQGTAGSYYHYFLVEDGHIHYVGMMPKLKFIKRQNLFQSIEKDGPKHITTYWEIEGNHFSKLTQVVKE